MRFLLKHKLLALIAVSFLSSSLPPHSVSAAGSSGVIIASGPDYEILSGSVIDGAGNTYSAIQFTKSFKIGSTSFKNPSPTTPATAVLKISNTGKILWSSPIATSSIWTGFNTESKLIIDENGNVSAVFMFDFEMDFAGKKFAGVSRAYFDSLVVQFDGDDGRVLWTQMLGGDEVSPVGTFGGNTYFLSTKIKRLGDATRRYICEESSRVVSVDATGTLKEVFSSNRASSEYVNVAAAKLNYKGDLLLLAQKRDEIVQSFEGTKCDEGSFYLLNYEIVSQKILSRTSVFRDSFDGPMFISAEILDTSQTGKTLVCSVPFVQSLAPSVMQISLVDVDGKLLWSKNADVGESNPGSCMFAVFDNQENIKAVLTYSMKTFFGKKVAPNNRLIVAKIAVDGSLKELKSIGTGKYISVGTAISRNPLGSAFLITGNFQGSLSIAGKRVAVTNNKSDSFLYKLPGS
jgi:hypothetical protein